MSSDIPQLHVRSGGRILGPLTVLDVADMIADGSLSETDLVSETGDQWKSIAEYVVEQAQAESFPAATRHDDLFSDDFAIQLEIPGDSAPLSPPPVMLAADSRLPAVSAAPVQRPTAPASPPPALEIAEGEVVELELAEEPATRPSSREEDEEEGGEPFYLLSGRDDSRPAAGAARPASTSPEKKTGEVKPRPATGKSGDDQQLGAMKALARDEVRAAPSRVSLPKAKKPLPPREPVKPPAGPTASPGPPSDMRPLFNGKDFSGWEFSPVEDWMNGLAEVWQVQEGIIHFDGKASRPHLISISDFGDFELWIGWRTLEPQCRGGIFLRSDADTSGAQTWISLSTAEAGKLLGANVSGSAAVPAFQNPPGQWNVWRIVAAGERIGLWCNRQCAWSSAVLNKPRGRIGLRADGTPLEFKFLQIREIKRK